MQETGRSFGGWLRRAGRRSVALAPLIALAAQVCAPTTAHAATMTASFIRIDPEPTVDEKKGTPVIPMLVELGVSNPINEFAVGCAVGGTGAKVAQTQLSCMSAKIQKDTYFKQYEFPALEDSHVMALVGGDPKPMDIVDAKLFKDATAPNAGVAWLILMDASDSVGTRWASMQETAEAIIKKMGEHDAVAVRIMDDKATREKTKWLAAGSKQQALTLIRKVTTTYKSGGNVDSLIGRVETETVGSFQDLLKSGVDGADDVVPLMQAVVILSDGGDTSGEGFAGGAKAQAIHEKLVKGEFVEGIRLPMPVISVWFPRNLWTGVLEENRRSNEYKWMMNMATPEVGGYFDIVQEGETGKGTKIASIVRNRFDSMHYLEVKASCLDTSGEQKFKLVFGKEAGKVLGGTWDKVPIAFDPTKWVLDIDKKKTEEAASKNPLLPGETFTVFGDFCWGSNAGAAEAYFVTESDAAEVKKAANDKSGKAAKALLQSLASKGQKAETVSASPLDAKFKVPNNPALFENKGETFSLNVVIVDNKSLRVSTRDKKDLLNLRAQKPPINKFLIVGAVGGGIVLILLIAILARGGGGGSKGRRGRRGGAPPAPGPTPGQPPPAPAPMAPMAFAPAPPMPLGPQVVNVPAATAFAPPQPAATAFAPPQPAYAPPQPAATAFAPPQPAPTAFAPPQPAPTAFAPPQPAPTAYAPAQPVPTAYAPPQPVVLTPAPPDTFRSGGAVMTGPTEAPAGLAARNKGATSFTTTCPNPGCRKPVLVPPNGNAQCAFCGTMVDALGQAVQGLPTGGAQFGLTGAASEATAAAAAAAVAAARPAPPTGTVALQPLSMQVRAIVLEGAAGTFRVLPGIEVRVGRDGTLCSISFAEPRVSGVHASLRLEGGILQVRDDKSHNGTYVNGNRIPPGTWTPVPGGSQLRFGPVELMVRHES